MDQDIVKHDHAISSWITLCVARDGVITTVLMVETDLSLNADAPNYQENAVAGLVEAAVAYVRDHSHIDTIEIEQLRQGRPGALRVHVHRHGGRSRDWASLGSNYVQPRHPPSTIPRVQL